ncbi:MAG: hypothetical protein GW795_03385 [Cyanobacteria bacterium]|nr:hypothetical protein [Cyanobacteria bacterium CG_2015-16_32_12]NCO78064.1 hypothetical protein [Cyanobacteria bacterium CG_2015-22_32_23]NCQ05723.1 hypothetical protein [Cyanobacteria bacterium CG_2015-09_32_10]NCQ40943.1 hypothetical protein [Cyanobacteria bacterium CG_2015-04_32_10]
MTRTVNCQIECVNGCILGQECPNQKFAQETTKFIENTSLDKILEMAEIARFKKITSPPKWIIPDDFS